MATYNTTTEVCDNIIFSNNIAYNSGFIISFQHNTINSQIINNTCYGSTINEGIIIYSYVPGDACYNNLIKGNTSYNNKTHGINLGWYVRDTVVEKNYCYNNDSFGIVVDAGASDNLIKNNICINNEENIGIEGNTAGQTYNIKFYNNILIYGVKTSFAGLFLDVDVGGHDITFKNNIVVSNDYRQEIMDLNDNFTNIVSNYNCFHENLDPSGPQFRYDGTNVYLTDWQATSQDTNSIVSDPLLTSDYRLTSTSPCKDAGVTLSEVTDDYEGNPRPMGASTDIGAYEWFKCKIGNVILRNCNL